LVDFAAAGFLDVAGFLGAGVGVGTTRGLLVRKLEADLPVTITVGFGVGALP
jgi:hypothetical protein